ncbi:MAG: methylenetetrahydrofolate reductase C-terminal domain-containing protein [Deltaproteobacteria bacterium]|nr:methylenetetrahydrofolate reductase C-terminal domain-containing protein [Deltaproteobacteria bacterium]
MIRSITQPKEAAELDRLLEGLTRLYVVGCGTCVTLTNTGGVAQVAAMSEALSQKGKAVTGSMVVPVACDQLSYEILAEEKGALETAEALVIMTCAYGVQTIGSQLKKMVIPALDTLFVGKETGPGRYQEVCRQCGQCVLGETGGLCPVTSCHKGLVNGPCGGTNQGKCEIDSNKDCVWTLIYKRLAEFDRLDLMRRYQPPKNYSVEPRPGLYQLP